MMRQVLKMQAEANALISILAQGIASQDKDLRFILNAKFDAGTLGTLNALESLDQSDREGDIGKIVNAIIEMGRGEKGVFQSQGNRLQRIQELVKLQDDFRPLFDPLVNVRVLEVKIKSDQLGRGTEQALTKLVKQDVNRLRYLLELQASANLLLGIMSQAAQVPSIDQLGPLQVRYLETSEKLATAAKNLPDSLDVRSIIEKTLVVLGARSHHKGFCHFGHARSLPRQRPAKMD